MEFVRQVFDAILSFFIEYRGELALSAIAFLFALAFERFLTLRARQKRPDLIGLKVVEDIPGQLLVRITNPGNVRAILPMVAPAKNVLVNTSRLDEVELEYALQLLRELGGKLGTTVVKLDEGLFLLKRASKGENSEGLSASVPIFDLEGNEVIR